MGRRGDQRHSRFAVAQPGDVVINLRTWELAPFTRLGPLSHFDLQLFGTTEVFRRDPKPSGCDLLNRRTCGIAIAQTSDAGKCSGPSFRINITQDLETGWIFTTFTAIALATDAIHRHSKNLMGLPRQGTKTHPTSAKSAEQTFHAFHLIEGKRSRSDLELQQITQRSNWTVLQQCFVGGKVVVSRASFHGSVQRLRHIWTVQVEFTTRAVLHKTHKFELAAVEFGESLGMQRQGFVGEFGKGHPGHTTGGAGKRHLNHVCTEADGLKNLCTVIAR